MKNELHFYGEVLMAEKTLFAEDCWVELEGGSYHSDSSALLILVLALKIWLLHLGKIHSWM